MTNVFGIALCARSSRRHPQLLMLPPRSMSIVCCVLGSSAAQCLGDGCPVSMHWGAAKGRLGSSAMEATSSLSVGGVTVQRTTCMLAPLLSRWC
mmetsp:Transcript_40060/g.114694  ORF Transcript_40060/g.114694 Transcript_40060/m.114694 type:complete len:94 (+) Transcript_40060:54-335(+)